MSCGTYTDLCVSARLASWGAVRRRARVAVAVTAVKVVTVEVAVLAVKLVSVARLAKVAALAQAVKLAAVVLLARAAAQGRLFRVVLVASGASAATGEPEAPVAWIRFRCPL